MVTLNTQVLVIGGGATGCGVAWDAALRGLDVVLVDRLDLAEGTSGRFHGLLHSGGRYAVKDPNAARECVAENAVLRRVAADCIEDTGGFFVATPFDDPSFGDRFVAGCAATGVPCEEISAGQALKEEPRLNPGISRAFRVLDANIDVWKTVWALTHGAIARGARVMTYHEVIGIHRDGDRVTGARLHDVRGGSDVDIEASVVVNATGAWAGQVADLAGIEGVRVLPGRGIMIAMNHRIVNTVINRCEMPGDGDILVPIRTVSVIGTTDQHTDDPDDHTVFQDEVDQMLADGEKLVPGFRQARALRVWTGARPLFEDAKSSDTETRDVTRAHALLDHRERDGVGGFVTITGGKLTTYRMMAEQTVDAVCAQLGVAAACTTAETPLPGSESGASYRLGERLARKEHSLIDDQIICECELVSRQRVTDAIDQYETRNLDDIRRQLRLGMGPCQGGFCIYRATGLLQAGGSCSAAEAGASLNGFLHERWKGIWPILHGGQLRQARLDDWIFHGILDIEHMPSAAPSASTQSEPPDTPSPASPSDSSPAPPSASSPAPRSASPPTPNPDDLPESGAST